MGFLPWACAGLLVSFKLKHEINQGVHCEKFLEDTVYKCITRIPTGGRLTCWLFTNTTEELNSGLPRTNPASGRMEDLNQGPTDFKSNALNHMATPPLIEVSVL